MTNKPHLKRRHEFELLQNHEQADRRKDKEIILVTIGLIIISLCLLVLIWSQVFSIRNFI